MNQWQKNMIQQLVRTLDSYAGRWFFCFGTLLSICRNQKIDMDQDIDIGIIGPVENACEALKKIMALKGCVLNHRGELLNAHFWDSRSKLSVDIFSWVLNGNYYWHTYDTLGENQEVLSLYEFKGTPKHYFDPTEREESRIPKKMKLTERAWNDKLKVWRFDIPGLEDECISGNRPYRYGACLDLWYPDWAKRRENFGVSCADKIITVKQCKEFYK